MGAAPLCRGDKLKFSPLLLVPASAVPFFCPPCPCTTINPTQLTHLSLCSWPWISFISSLEVPDPWADPDFCHWTCPALAWVLWHRALGAEGAAPAPIPVTSSSGLPSLEEQLGLAAPWQLKIKILLGVHKLIHRFEWFLRKLSSVFTSSGGCAVTHKKPKFYF